MRAGFVMCKTSLAHGLEPRGRHSSRRQCSWLAPVGSGSLSEQDHRTTVQGLQGLGSILVGERRSEGGLAFRSCGPGGISNDKSKADAILIPTCGASLPLPLPLSLTNRRNPPAPTADSPCKLGLQQLDVCRCALRFLALVSVSVSDNDNGTTTTSTPTTAPTVRIPWPAQDRISLATRVCSAGK
jgi:hypothetical protein